MENNLAVEALMTYNNLLKDNPDLILQDFPEELILAFYKLKFPQKIATSVSNINECNSANNAIVALGTAFTIGYSVKGLESKIYMNKMI